MAGVYISFPFCAQKCTYCNFASGVFPRSLEDEYTRALVAEIERHIFEWRPETVFLGGGTPSSMDLPALEAVLSAIPGAPWKEATLEAAPGSITVEKARAWRAGGINRVSLGVQSFVRQEIAATGRKHTAGTVVSHLDTLREAGIANFNIDLIAGLAGQTGASWRESLDWIERLGAPHVSIYMLEIDEDSRPQAAKSLLGGVRYGAGAIPEDAAAIADHVRICGGAAGCCLGIPRYEISNFARRRIRIGAQFAEYWRSLEPYIGFGADAHSFDGARRWQNPESAADYVAGAAGESAHSSNPGEEKFFVGLRLAAGIRPSPEEWLKFDAPIRRFEAEGLLEREGGTLRLSNRGVLLSNEVFQEFLNL